MTLEKYRIEYANGIIQEKYLVPKGIEFFTENSPLGEALTSKSQRLILPKDQGGDHGVVKFIKL